MIQQAYSNYWAHTLLLAASISSNSAIIFKFKFDRICLFVCSRHRTFCVINLIYSSWSLLNPSSLPSASASVCAYCIPANIHLSHLVSSCAIKRKWWKTSAAFQKTPRYSAALWFYLCASKCTFSSPPPPHEFALNDARRSDELGI